MGNDKKVRFGGRGCDGGGGRMLAKENSIFFIKSWNPSFTCGARGEKHPGRMLGWGHGIMTVL